ncbi:expressed unknown protein [Seminavis robusta]|uniref:Uncharacterized protein n=1 Tax=Seminavis robusta TaxID=568900 RepID=A0A9N8HB79_9STRA|nr:expressed unknown protein [Seminavis robusta]|eukprot:Sro326_g118050.1 n/a (254) ;mRNA; r:23862-24760
MNKNQTKSKDNVKSFVRGIGFAKTENPTNASTVPPSAVPKSSPTASPTQVPTASPTTSPTAAPSDEWIQVSHNNTLYPSDIFCRRNAGRDECQRRCAAYEGTPRNRMIMAKMNRAGVGDRKAVFMSLSELAGYLCATITEKELDQNTAAMRRGDSPPEDGIVWQKIDTWSDDTITRNCNLARIISMREQHDGKEPNRFIWNMNAKFYSVRDAFWKDIQALEASSPSTLRLPTIGGSPPLYQDGNCPHHRRHVQ